jgi:hypothetical protein
MPKVPELVEAELRFKETEAHTRYLVEEMNFHAEQAKERKDRLNKMILPKSDALLKARKLQSFSLTGWQKRIDCMVVSYVRYSLHPDPIEPGMIQQVRAWLSRDHVSSLLGYNGEGWRIEAVSSGKSIHFGMYLPDETEEELLRMSDKFLQGEGFYLTNLENEFLEQPTENQEAI